MSLEIKKRFIGEEKWESPVNGNFQLIYMDEEKKTAYYYRELKPDKMTKYIERCIEIVNWTDADSEYPSNSKFGSRGICIPVQRLVELGEYYREKYRIPEEVFELLICAT